MVRYTVRTAWFMVKAFFKARRVEKKTKDLPEKERWQKAYEFLRPECADLLKTTGSRVIYHGLENLPDKPGALFVGNHTSILDIPALISVMEFPTAFVSKKELDNTPMVGKLLKLIGCVSLDRQNIRQALEAVKEASERLQQGINMVVFPEGTRSKTGQIGEFKKGSIRIATAVGAPVVPFRIEGLRGVLEGNKGIQIEPREVHIYFGKPIEVAGMTRQEQKKLADDMRRIVVDLT